jgi:aryl-alcohol dehydrogenase-like predicted oxidoreductase
VGDNSRRAFFSKAAGLAGIGLLGAAAPSDVTPATVGTAQIPLRQFGRHSDVMVSALGLGGHHLGDAPSAEAATRIAHEAIDGGIRFFDNAWEYNNHRSEEYMGIALRGGYRDKVFLMTKVCTHGRDGSLALQMLEESLQRLETDHLDLWQIHAITYDNDPELAYRKGGVIEALAKAKQQGKTRFVGFTGHKDPLLHLAMLKGGFQFDSVQMPLNPFDAQFRSFAKQVVPEAVRQGVAVLGMKPFNGDGGPFHAGDVKLTPTEALHYAMSVPGVTITITGMENVAVVRQNLEIAKNFTPLTPERMAAIEQQVAPQTGDGHLEIYKTSLAYDNIITRQAHEMPIAGAHP